MKTCPLCRRSYEDDSLVFCLDDGTRLVGRTDQPDPNATWHLPQAPSSSEAAPTVMPPRPTVPSPQATITARPDQFQYRQPIGDEPSSHKRNPLPWILAIVFVIGISAVAVAFILTRGGSTDVATKNPTPDPRGTPIVATPEPTQSPRTSPQPTVNPPNKETTPKPTPAPTLERAKPAFTLMNNISYSGGSRITYYPRASVGGCQADCAANASCRAFTWIRPGAYNPGDSAMCYIMASVSGPVSHPCCISGVKN